MPSASFSLKALLLVVLAPSLWAASTELDLDQPFFKGAARDLAMIPTTARWAAYVDLTDPRQAELGRGLFRSSVLPSLDIDPETSSQVRQLANELTSITVYGGALGSDLGWQSTPVAILEGHPILADRVRATLRARIKAAPDSVTSSEKALRIESYALRPPHAPGASPVYVAFPADSHFVVVSKSIPQLQEAMRAPFRREHDPAPAGPGADATSVNALLSRQGSFILRAAIQTPQAEDGASAADSQLLKLAEAARLFVTIDGSQVHASLHVKAPDEDTASRLAQVMQGMIAMYALSGRSGDWAQLLNTARVRSEGSYAIADADYPVARLLAIAARDERPTQAGFAHMEAYGREVGSSRSGASTLPRHAGERQTHLFMHVRLVQGDVITVASRSSNPDTRQIDSVELVPAGGDGADQAYVPMRPVPASDPNSDNTALFQGTFTGADGRYDLVFLTVPDEVGPVAFDVRVADPADRSP